MNMKKTFQRICLGLCMSLTIPMVSQAHAVIAKHEASIAPMLNQAMPSVVNITVEAKVPDYILQQLPNGLAKKDLPKPMMIGSGVIFNAAKGLIITNDHVIHDAKIIVVTLKDGRRFRANVVAAAKSFDLAVLHIDAKKLKQMPFANSDNLKVGDFVAAIGSPFGLTQTVTSGVVSALNRDRPKIEGFQSFIQTDAPINPGNSGGALVNMQGQLVGINTAILSRVDSNIGIGFAIPSNMTKAVIMQLLKYGKVERGMLGVMAQNITPDLQQAMALNSTKGALVTQYIDGSPAQQAGLQSRDVILMVNHETIHSADQLRNDLGLMRPGTDITLTILRDHKTKIVHATIADPKKFIKKTAIPFIAGVTLRDFNEIQSNGAHIKGAQIVDTTDASNAAIDGLQPGDVITAIGNTKVTSAAQVKKIIETNKKASLLITFSRANTRLFAVLQR